MTRYPVMPAGGGGGEPRRERVLTYDRGSQAWEPKLGHEGGNAKITKPRIEIVAMAGEKRARVFFPRAPFAQNVFFLSN